MHSCFTYINYTLMDGYTCTYSVLTRMYTCTYTRVHVVYAILHDGTCTYTCTCVRGAVLAIAIAACDDRYTCTRVYTCTGRMVLAVPADNCQQMGQKRQQLHAIPVPQVPGSWYGSMLYCINNIVDIDSIPVAYATRVPV